MASLDDLKGSTKETVESGPKPDELDVNDPYKILDKYVKATSEALIGTDKGQEAELREAKAEVGLLHNQLLFERHRREALALRNRRLLSKTKSLRVLEEQNTAFSDRLRIASSEISILFEQLENLRREKHEEEAEWAKKEIERNERIERLSKEKAELVQTNGELVEKTRKQAELLAASTAEVAKLESALFNNKSHVDRLEKKEDVHKLTQSELVEMRKQVLMQGELIRKYRESMDKPVSSSSAIFDTMYKEAFKEEIRGLKDELRSRASDVEVMRGRTHELEDAVLRKDEAIEKAKNDIRKICDGHDEQMANMEAAYEYLKATYMHLEGRCMELNDMLAKSTRQRQKGSRGFNVARVNPTSTPKRGHASASVTVPTVAVPVGISEKSSFVVGSPPSSSGSDQSEVIRRAIGRDDGSLWTTQMSDIEAGSVSSAKETFGTSAGSNRSINGVGGSKR